MTDFSMNKAKRLQALDKAYLPTPHAKRLVLRSHLTKSSRTTKLSPKPSPLKLFQKPAPDPISLSHFSSALNSPTHSSKSRKLQMTASASTSLNQSEVYKSPSSQSLLQSPTRPGTQAFAFPTFGAQEEVEFPLSAGQVLKRFGKELSMYEQGEILEYKQVYCFGKDALKVQTLPTLPNNGYDDDRSDYRVVLGDHLAYRYEILDILGKGSFGVVLRCNDRKQKETVAIKIIRNKRKFHQQGLVEVKVLEALRNGDPEDEMGIVRMRSFFQFRCHICIVFELLSMNLYELLKTNGHNGFSTTLIRRFAVQLLVSLLYVQKSGIVHCDLKPENVLLTTSNKSAIKLIDFGSSCFQNARIYTYIQSRFYRAPEIILGIPYTFAIDMWSLGCILAELYRGYPLFPGESEMEQLQYMMEALGLPPKHMQKNSGRWEHFFEQSGAPKLVENTKGEVHYPGTKRLERLIGAKDASFVQFVERCLDWDPRTRMTPEEGLRHEWLLELGRTAVGLRDTHKSKHPIRIRRNLSKASP